MDRNNKQSAPLGCEDCLDGLQDYLDGTLEKTRSLQFFLHLRECAECQQAHDDMKALFGVLESLPEHEVPADFNAKILAAVPYEAYRAMEPIRRERVPVFLEEEFLPAAIRSTATRTLGLGLAVAGIILGPVTGVLDSISLISLLGFLPETLVRLQGVGRRAALAVRRSEG